MRIEIDNNIIEFNVQYNVGTKLSIHFDSLGCITVKVPKDTSKRDIISAVEHQYKWILAQTHKFAKTRESVKVSEYHDEGKFLYLGKECRLDELIETSELGKEELQKNLKKFYFTSCKRIVESRMKIYQNQLRVKPKTMEIEESITKWGTCSSDKKITINYRLVMAPIDVIDYVVIHELCHLKHMNHDRSFWRLVGSVMPDYKEKQEYLARNGYAMTL